jgi:hypothetical protein
VKIGLKKSMKQAYYITVNFTIFLWKKQENFASYNIIKKNQNPNVFWAYRHGGLLNRQTNP